jgi:hypothetical protein
VNGVGELGVPRTAGGTLRVGTLARHASFEQGAAEHPAELQHRGERAQIRCSIGRKR